MDYSKKTKEELIKEIESLKNNNDFESLKSYKDLFNNNTSLLYIQTKEGQFIDINKKVIDKYGYKREEIIGKYPDFLAGPGNDISKITALIDKAWDGGQQTFEFIAKTKEGKIFIKKVTSQKGYYFGKKVIVSSAIDITEKKSIENHLKESEEKYRNLFNNNLAGVFITENGIITECNNSFAKIYGYKSRVELIGKKAIDFYFDKNDRKKYIDDLTSKKQLNNYKLRNKKRDGSEIWVSTNTSFFLLENNTIKTIGTLVDVTEQISYKNKVEEELIANKKYTKNVLNSSLDIIYASDIKGNIIEFNYAAEKAFGYNKKDIFGLNRYLLFATKEEYLKVNKKLLNTGSFVGETKNISKSGIVFSSFLTISGLYNDKGENIGTVSVSRDITEIKETEKQLLESEYKFLNLSENATDLIKTVDMEGNILFVNKSWHRITGYLEKEIKSIYDVLHPDFKKESEKVFKDITLLKEGENKKTRLQFKNKNGKKVILDSTINLNFKYGKPVSIRSISRDITEEIWEEKKQNVYNNITRIVVEKIKSEDIYEGIRQELGKIMNTETFIISYSLNKETLTFPYYYDSIYSNGKVDKKNRTKGKGINEYFLKKSKIKLLKRPELDKIIRLGGYNISGIKCKAFVGVPLKIKNKTIGVLSVQSFDDENAYTNKSIEILEYISGKIALIVQRKQDQNIISEQASKLKSIIENSSHLFWSYDINKGVTSSNQNFIDYIEEAYEKKVIINKKTSKLLRFSDEDQHDFWDKKYAEAFKGKPQKFISKNKKKNGEYIVKEVYLNPIYNEEGKIIEISGIANDITEKTIYEQKIKESLKEKEVLLKEVHHRVKNNLQVISSILNLQSSYVKDQNILDILRESQNRIKSMSFIHESLYQNTDFSEINFSEYVVSLSKNLVHSYGLYDDLIDLEFSVGNISLNLDISIPCGLIINELISNALKYAFYGIDKGKIKIYLFEKNGNVHLIVQDNGLGLPKEINFRETDSLGLQLVTTLVEQINGTIELNNDKGAEFTIIFKKEQ